MRFAELVRVRGAHGEQLLTPLDLDLEHSAEVFNTGRSAGKPFAARMRIQGATRIEAWTRHSSGRAVRQRIVYGFLHGGKVNVSFQQSDDGKHWKTTAIGAGEKIG